MEEVSQIVVVVAALVVEIMTKKPSRIDIIGQNGNDGIHYEIDYTKETPVPKELFSNLKEEKLTKMSSFEVWIKYSALPLVLGILLGLVIARFNYGYTKAVTYDCKKHPITARESSKTRILK